MSANITSLHSYFIHRKYQGLRSHQFSRSNILLIWCYNICCRHHIAKIFSWVFCSCICICSSLLACKHEHEQMLHNIYWINTGSTQSSKSCLVNTLVFSVLLNEKELLTFQKAHISEEIGIIYWQTIKDQNQHWNELNRTQNNDSVDQIQWKWLFPMHGF